MKHPQSILAVEAQPFVASLGLKPGFNVVDEDAFFAATKQHLVIALRDKLDNQETTTSDVLAQLEYIAALHDITIHIESAPKIEYKGDRSKLQLLPYLVFTEVALDGVERVARYQRGKGVGEERLAGNNSIGYGGHPDLLDVLTRADVRAMSDDEDLITDECESIIEVKATLQSALRREIEEEVVVEPRFPSNAKPKFLGLILDRSNDVGHLHLGVVYRTRLFEGQSALPAEEQLLKMEPLTVEELAEDDKLESWSKILTQYLIEEDKENAES